MIGADIRTINVFVKAIAVLLLCRIASTVKSDGKCNACQFLVKSFKQGLRETEKLNLGGGDTAWEEKQGFKYGKSETRFVEVIDYTCRVNGKKAESIEDNMFPSLLTDKDADHACHALLEEHEESVENWFFHKQQSNPDLYKWLCIDTLKKCCPSGSYGKECVQCEKHDTYDVCSGRGKCDGDGTRSGDGKCACDKGYIGKHCHKCANNYYEAPHNQTHMLCEQCHTACKGECTSGDTGGCKECKTGWVWQDSKCTDVDECKTGTVCTGSNERCVNYPGSHSCDCLEGHNRVDGACVANAGEANTLNDDDDVADDSESADDDMPDWDHAAKIYQQNVDSGVQMGKMEL